MLHKYVTDNTQWTLFAESWLMLPILTQVLQCDLDNWEGVTHVASPTPNSIGLYTTNFMSRVQIYGPRQFYAPVVPDAYTQVFLNAEVPNFDFPDLNS